MRYVSAFVAVLLAVLVVPSAKFSQGGQMETSKGVAGGGITVSRVDREDRCQRRSRGVDAQQRQAGKRRLEPARSYWSSRHVLEPEEQSDR